MDFQEALQLIGLDDSALRARALGRNTSPQIAKAAEKSKALDLLNFAATAGSNNPGLTKAVETLADSQRRTASPMKMGENAVLIPETGEFVTTPAYEDAKLDQRRGALFNAVLASQDRRANVEAQNERAREGNALKMMIAQLAAQTRAASDAAKQANKAAKPLPTNLVNGINKLDVTDTSQALLENFKEDFAVPAITGSMSNAVGRTGIGQALGLGSSPETVNWWQNYNNMKNLYRNTLFGSALTQSEKEAFDAANIKEGDSAETIRTRLAQQHAAAVRAYNKLVKNAAKGGYDTSEFLKPDFAPPPPGSKSQTPQGDGWTITPRGQK